eukprot:m.45424 g.45424  ORF g.45424 m.45424 type:complete len:957 (-) comp11780_c0_seq1:164-3034(-)
MRVIATLLVVLSCVGQQHAHRQHVGQDTRNGFLAKRQHSLENQLPNTGHPYILHALRHLVQRNDSCQERWQRLKPLDASVFYMQDHRSKEVYQYVLSLDFLGLPCDTYPGGTAVCLRSARQEIHSILIVSQDSNIGFSDQATCYDDDNEDIFHVSYSGATLTTLLGQLVSFALPELENVLDDPAYDSMLNSTITRKLCQSLEALNIFSSTFLDCSNPPELKSIVNAVVPLLHALGQSTETQTLTSVSFHCDPNVEEKPKLVANGNLPQMSHANLTAYGLELHHACACANATDDCMKLPAARAAKNRARTCATYNQYGLYYATVASVAVVVLVLCVETCLQCRRARDVRSRWGQFCCCCVTMLSPVELLEDRRVSIVTASIFAAMSGLIAVGLWHSGASGAGYLACIVFYPLFICKRSSYPLLGSVLGLIHAACLTAWLSLVLICFGQAREVEAVFLQVIPVVFLLVVVGFYARRVVRGVFWRKHKPAVHVLHWQVEHVQGLLRRQPVAAPSKSTNRLSVLDRAKSTAKAISSLHHIISPRMLCMSGMSVALLACLVCLWSIGCRAFATLLEEQLSGGRCCGYDKCFEDDLAHQAWQEAGVSVDLRFSCNTNGIINDAVHWTFVSCGILSALINMAYLYRMLTVYNAHMRKLYRGDRSGFATLPSPTSALRGTLSYAGFQVAYISFGWLFGSVTLCIVCLFITFTTVLPIIHVFANWFWVWFYRVMIWSGGPGILTMAAANYAAGYMAVRYLFQADKGTVAIKHRVMFNTFDFVQFFVSINNGVLSALKRVAWSLLFVTIYISRLDVCTTPQGHELWDPGHQAFLKFLFVDLFYSNPVLRQFVDLLAQDCIVDEDAMPMATLSPEAPLLSSVAQPRARPGANRLIINRWSLAVTLLNNPTLRSQRKHQLATDEPRAVVTHSDTRSINGLSSGDTHVVTSATQATHLPATGTDSESEA